MDSPQRLTRAISNLPNDYKASKHAIYGTSTDIGRAFMSVLNIYGAVPLYGKANSEYNVLNSSETDVEAFLSANNSSIGEDIVSSIAQVWNEIYAQIDDSTIIKEYSSSAAENVLKRRFPVVVFDKTAGSNNEVANVRVITDTDHVSASYMFDTYQYLTQMVNRKDFAVNEQYNESGGREKTITLSYNEEMQAVYKMVSWDNAENEQCTEFRAQAGINLDQSDKKNIRLVLNKPDCVYARKIAVGILTQYNNGLPKVNYTNKVYVDILYSDVAKGSWYWEYIFKATNKEIVNGFGNGVFAPEESLTRGQFLKMLLVAIDVDQTDYQEIDSDMKNRLDAYLGGAPGKQ